MSFMSSRQIHLSRIDSAIRRLIEDNRNPAVRSRDEFEVWLAGPKADLFKRRAAEVLQTMRTMRLIAADRGGNPAFEVARQMPRMNEFMTLARSAGRMAVAA